MSGLMAALLKAILVSGENGVRPEIEFVRLSEIDPHEIVLHMADPRVATHLPLLKGRV